jgi:O-antigen ligase
LLIVVPAVFDPAGALAFEPVKTSVLRVGAAIAAAAWLARRFSRCDVVDVGAHPVVRAGLAFIGVAAVSSLLSIEPPLSLFGSFDRGMGWLSLAAGGILLLCVADVFADEVRRERLITALLLGAVIPCAYLLLQRIGRDPFVWNALGAPGSSLASPTLLGGYLVVIAPFALYRVIRSARSGSSSMTYAGWLALLLIVCTVTLLTTIRGPILGLAIGVGTFGILAGAGRGLGYARVGAGLGALILALGLAVVAAGGAGTTGLQRFLSIARTGDSSVERLTVWRDALALPLAEPLRAGVGFGPETQQAILERAEATVRLTQNQQWDRAHNLLLDTWLTTGGVGVAVLVWLISAAGASAWQARRKGSLLACAVLGALIGHLVEVSFAFESVTSGMLFWLLMGLAASLTPRGTIRFGFYPHPRWLVGVSVASGLALAPLLLTPAVADRLYGQAGRSDALSAAGLEDTAASLVPWVEELPRAAALNWQRVANARNDAAARSRVEADLLASAARAAGEPFPQLRLSRWYQLQGDLPRSMAACERALALGPYRATVWDTCAGVSLAEGRTDVAEVRRARAEQLRQPL